MMGMDTQALAQAAGSIGVLVGGLIGGPPKKPSLYQPLDLGTTLKDVASANLKTLPTAEEFGAKSSDFLTAQWRKSADALFPWLNPLLEKAGEQAMANLSGKLSKDTVDEVQRQSAAWGITSGAGRFGLSPLTDSYAGRQLGLRSREMIDRGMQEVTTMQQWADNALRIASGTTQNFSNSFITGAQGVARADEQNQLVYASKRDQEATPSGKQWLGGLIQQVGGTLAGVSMGGGFNQAPQWTQQVIQPQYPGWNQGTGEYGGGGYGLPDMGAGDWAGETGAATAF